MASTTTTTTTMMMIAMMMQSEAEVRAYHERRKADVAASRLGPKLKALCIRTLEDLDAILDVENAATAGDSASTSASFRETAAVAYRRISSILDRGGYRRDHGSGVIRRDTRHVVTAGRRVVPIPIRPNLSNRG